MQKPLLLNAYSRSKIISVSCFYLFETSFIWFSLELYSYRREEIFLRLILPFVLQICCGSNMPWTHSHSNMLLTCYDNDICYQFAMTVACHIIFVQQFYRNILFNGITHFNYFLSTQYPIIIDLGNG